MRSSNRYRLARQFDRDAHAEVLRARDQDRVDALAAHAAQAPARERRDRSLLAAWDALNPGDTFKPGNNEITIKRKNAWSVTDTNGINWSIAEVIGLSRKEVEVLKAAE